MSHANLLQSPFVVDDGEFEDDGGLMRSAAMHDNAYGMETEAEIMAELRKNQTQYDDYEDKFYKKTRKNKKKRVRRQEREYYVDDKSILAWGTLWLSGPQYQGSFDTSEMPSMDEAGAVKNNIFVSSGKQLFAVGLNRWKELGETTSQKVEVLSMINEFNEEVVCIGSGNTAQHVIVATSTNIYASGRNDYGQCGLGPDVRSVQGVVGFEQIDMRPFEGKIAPSEITKIVLGATSTVIISRDGQTFFCGIVNDFDTHGVFIDLGETLKDLNIRDVALGGNTKGPYLVILSHDGRLWSVGSNQHGQLGHSYGEKFVEIKLVEGQKSKFKRVIASEYHFVAVSAKNKVYTCGRKDAGRLGRGKSADGKLGKVKGLPKNTEVLSVCTTRAATIVAYKNGDIWFFGDNEQGIYPSRDREFYRPVLLGNYKPVEVVLGCDSTFLKVAALCYCGKYISNPFAPKTCETCRGRLLYDQVNYDILSQVGLAPRDRRKSQFRDHSSNQKLASMSSFRDKSEGGYGASSNIFAGNLSPELLFANTLSPDITMDPHHVGAKNVHFGRSESQFGALDDPISKQVFKSKHKRNITSLKFTPEEHADDEENLEERRRKRFLEIHASKAAERNNTNADKVMEFMYKSAFGVTMFNMLEKGMMIFDVGTDITILRELMASKTSDDSHIVYSMIMFMAIISPYIVCWTAGLRYLEDTNQSILKALYVIPITGFAILVLFDAWLVFDAFVWKPIKLFLSIFGFPLTVEVPTRDEFSYSRLKQLSELFLENIVQVCLQVVIWNAGEGLDLAPETVALAVFSSILNISYQTFSLYAEAAIYHMNFFDYALLIMEGNFNFTPFLDSISSGEMKTVDYTNDDYGTIYLTGGGLKNLYSGLESPHCNVQKLDLGSTCSSLNAKEREELWKIHDLCAKQFIELSEDYTTEIIEKDGAKILRMACRKGYRGTVQDILNLGDENDPDKHVDPNASDALDDGMTALMFACSEQHYAIVGKLLDDAHIKKKDRPKPLLDIQDNHQRTALIHVVMAKNLDIDFVRLLLDHPQDLNLTNAEGRSALSLLSDRGKNRRANKAVTFILDSKQVEPVDINLACNDGISPLMYAARGDSGIVLEALLKFRRSEFKEKKGDKNVYEESLCIDLNQKDNLGRTALHYACMEGNSLIVKFLLCQKGIEVNSRTTDLDGQVTPLMFACDWGHKEVIKALIRKKADVNIRDKFKRSALLRAVRADSLVSVRTLLRKGSDVEVGYDWVGKNAFDYASKRCHAVFKIHLDDPNLPIKIDLEDIEYKLESLTIWTRLYQHDRRLKHLLELCDGNLQMAEKRFEDAVKHAPTKYNKDPEKLIKLTIADLIWEKREKEEEAKQLAEQEEMLRNEQIVF